MTQKDFNEFVYYYFLTAELETDVSVFGEMFMDYAIKHGLETDAINS